MTTFEFSNKLAFFFTSMHNKGAASASSHCKVNMNSVKFASPLFHLQHFITMQFIFLSSYRENYLTATLFFMLFDFSFKFFSCVVQINCFSNAGFSAVRFIIKIAKVLARSPYFNAGVLSICLPYVNFVCAHLSFLLPAIMEIGFIFLYTCLFAWKIIFRFFYFASKI